MSGDSGGPQHGQCSHISWTHVPYISTQTLNPWATRDVQAIENLQSLSPLYFTLLIPFTGIEPYFFCFVLGGKKGSWQLSFIWFCTAWKHLLPHPLHPSLWVTCFTSLRTSKTILCFFREEENSFDMEFSAILPSQGWNKSYLSPYFLFYSPSHKSVVWLQQFMPTSAKEMKLHIFPQADLS